MSEEGADGAESGYIVDACLSSVGEEKNDSPFTVGGMKRHCRC